MRELNVNLLCHLLVKGNFYSAISLWNSVLYLNFVWFQRKASNKHILNVSYIFLCYLEWSEIWRNLGRFPSLNDAALSLRFFPLNLHGRYLTYIDTLSLLTFVRQSLIRYFGLLSLYSWIWTNALSGFGIVYEFGVF